MNMLAGEGATVAGSVLPGPAATVTMRSRLGTARVLDMFSGEQLPRICWAERQAED